LQKSTSAFEVDCNTPVLIYNIFVGNPNKSKPIDCYFRGKHEKLQKKSVCQKFFLKTIKLFLKSKKEFNPVLKAKSRQFPMTEDKANTHAGMPFCGISRFVMPAFQLVVGNSPFGAWVVCIYQSEAVESPALVNAANPHPFFVSIQDWCRAF